MSATVGNDSQGMDALQYCRLAVQALVFVFLNGKAVGIYSSTPIIVPYLWPTHAPFSTAHGVYDTLEYTIARGMFPLLALGVIGLTGILVGRIFCGWACPLGMVQDLLALLPGFRRRTLPNHIAALLSEVKWGLLIFSLVCAGLHGVRHTVSVGITRYQPGGPHPTPGPEVGTRSAWGTPAALMSPSGTLFGYVPYMAMHNGAALETAGWVGWFKLMILILTCLVPGAYMPRFFCRFLCPLGALFEPLASYKVLRLRRNTNKPVERINKVLGDVCPMGVVLSEADDYFTSGSCITCGKCITILPNDIAVTPNEHSARKYWNLVTRQHKRPSRAERERESGTVS